MYLLTIILSQMNIQFFETRYKDKSFFTKND